MKYVKPNVFCYRLAQILSWLVAKVLFGRKFLRNEIRGQKGPYVVIANHQAKLDFVNLIGATWRPVSFVISQAFFTTLPIQGFLRKMGVIPKQQFQTSANDLKKMKRVIEAGAPLVIYPAGLMCEDGLSTPIPAATYKFLKWLDADVYVARTQGSYFVMPKWSKGIRPGRTTMDIYKLFSREELKDMDLQQIQDKTDKELLYDAYREQETLRYHYWNNRNICGLEHVLYQCPNCGTEFSMEVSQRSTITCSHCGYAQNMDTYGFFHNSGGIGPEIRYASDWSRMIQQNIAEKIESGQEQSLCAETQIHMVDTGKHKFVPVGSGTVLLQPGKFTIEGTIHGEAVCLEIPSGNVPTLPFGPGKYLEVQDGGVTYRCVLNDGKMVMKFIHMQKHFCRQIQKEIKQKAG